jgi:hypothetical protein
LTSAVTLKFTLHRGFVADGKYDVYVGGKKAIIEVKRERNSYARQKIFRRINNELLYADISDLIDASGRRKEGYKDMSSIYVVNAQSITSSSQVAAEKARRSGMTKGTAGAADAGTEYELGIAGSNK